MLEIWHNRKLVLLHPEYFDKTYVNENDLSQRSGW